MSQAASQSTAAAQGGSINLVAPAQVPTIYLIIGAAVVAVLGLVFLFAEKKGK